ncbi:MAG: PadR family transcriptional regulator [bacterium]|nr:PadR family transcriptional regulator [bacterium]
MPGVEKIQDRWLRGLLEACVLAVLQEAPAYGYEIATRFEDAGFSRPKGGTLYPILARLEKDDLVEPKWVEGESGPSRKYYSLTRSGVATADAIAPEWELFAKRVSQLVGQRERTSA